MNSKKAKTLRRAAFTVTEPSDSRYAVGDVITVPCVMIDRETYERDSAISMEAMREWPTI